MAATDPARDAILALATGAWRQAVLALAAELDLFALLGARAADLEEVCYSLGTQRFPTLLFLAACEGLQLVERRDDAYVLGGLAHPLLTSGRGTLADWANATSDPTLRARLAAALVGQASGPAEHVADSVAASIQRDYVLAGSGAVREASDEAERVRAYAAIEGLHRSGAEALAGILPPPADGLLLQVGGPPFYSHALLAQAPHLQAAIVGSPPWVLAADTKRRVLTAEHGVVVLPDLRSLGERCATLAVLAQPLQKGSAAALREQLTAVRDHLVVDAPAAVVGPFLPTAAGPRPVAPLLALAGLAAGQPWWCPTTDVVASQLQAAGFTRTTTLILPEPDVAVLGEP